MKKSLLFVAAASALLLTACSSDNEATQIATQQAAPQAIAFDTYVPTTTRSGQTGVMTTTTLQTTGFGVFATYSDGVAYDAETAKPNFMYNQFVHFTSAWEYSPLKYWPNETLTDSQSPAATGGVTTADNLSFFAYAPYVASPEAGTGITALSANNATGDPTVSYTVAPLPENSVDLLWGVAPAGNLTYTAVDGNGITVAEGMPLLNLVKPNKDQKMKFLFKHALSRIGLSVVGAFDQIAAGGTKDDNTKITVKQIDIYGKDQIGMSGVLSLNNTSKGAGIANWTTITKQASDDPVFTIGSSALNTTIVDKDNVAFTNQNEGVTTAVKNVFADATKYFMVIPTGSTTFTVKIQYYVQTMDNNLATTGNVDGSRILNTITKDITVNLENNKAYNLKLILGMTSVKLDAEVADWEVDGSNEVYLPKNNE